MNGRCELCTQPADILHMFYHRQSGQIICRDCLHALVRIMGEA